MTGFTERAQRLIVRLEDGESVQALAGELAALRTAWRGLDADERAHARDLAAALGARTRSVAADDDGDARRALQGLDTLAPSAPLRLYDGPPDPDALLAHYGLTAFRPGQREAVQAALDGRDALVIMPTGGGKSLCYSLPALATARLTVVVSPLIALMSDQYRRLAAGGHPAVMLASGLSDDHNGGALARIRSGEAQIVLCSPERFATRSFLDALGRREVGLFAVDEAHCLSEWGHDFRPDYLRLRDARRRLGDPPTMACTATATPAVAEEIVARLGLRDPLTVHGGFDRPNLSFDVVPFDGRGAVERKLATLVAIVSEAENRPAIVYGGTRKDVEAVAARLREHRLEAVAYHAGLPPDERASAQHRFMEGDAEIVVATNAFGMGVDKANVRAVIHHATPTSVEAYYQEAGRAGRDGLPARAVLLAMRADLGRLIRFNEQRSVTVSAVDAYVQRLRRASDGGSVVIDAPRNDEDRVALAVAERAAALSLSPAGGGRLAVELTGTLDLGRAREICQVAVDRGWQAYRAIERYAWGERACRRRQILDHFGDPSPGAPTGRCCDVCDPPSWIPTAEQVTALARPARRTGGGSAGSGGRLPDAPVVLSPADAALLAQLTAWRRSAADGKPAYTVAHNATLRAIAQTRPTDAEALLAISGVGPTFVERHAGAVLALVAGAAVD